LTVAKHLFQDEQCTRSDGQLGCSLLLDLMRQVTTVWCLYLILLSLFIGPVYAGPCPSRGTLSWAITQNCSLDTAAVGVIDNKDVATLFLEGAAAGELPTVLLSGPALTGVLTPLHHIFPATLSSNMPQLTPSHVTVDGCCPLGWAT
jgi:hypothetical protein